MDITAQILYQAPFFEAENSALELIGLNKFVNFTIIEETSYDKHYEVNLLSDQLFLVLAKAFTYLFMSFQILVYSSESFQEYYFSYMITKKRF